MASHSPWPSHRQRQHFAPAVSPLSYWCCVRCVHHFSCVGSPSCPCREPSSCIPAAAPPPPRKGRRKEQLLLRKGTRQAENYVNSSTDHKSSISNMQGKVRKRMGIPHTHRHIKQSSMHQHHNTCAAKKIPNLGFSLVNRPVGRRAPFPSLRTPLQPI